MATPGDERDLRQLPLIRQRLADLEAENVSLRQQLDRLQQPAGDASLTAFVGSVAAAAAVGEAAMPGRAVASISVTAQSYLVQGGGEVGLRFVPPELAASPTGLSTTTVELAKVPGFGGRAPTPLFAILEEKQRLYAGLAWNDIEAAGNVVAETGKALASSGSWSLGSLVEASAAIAKHERAAVAALAKARRRKDVAAYRRAVNELVELTAALVAKPRLVAADLHALSGSLERTTRAAASVPQPKRS